MCPSPPLNLTYKFQGFFGEIRNFRSVLLATLTEHLAQNGFMSNGVRTSPCMRVNCLLHLGQTHCTGLM